MSVIALCERGLVIDLFSNSETTYPSETYAYSSNTIFSYWDGVLSFYDARQKSTIKEYPIEDCKQLQISECGSYGGALTLKKDLFVYSHDKELFLHKNINAFSLSSVFVSFSRASTLYVHKIADPETKAFGNVFYFKAFGEFLVIVQKIKSEERDCFRLQVWRDSVVGNFVLETLERIDAKTDGRGNFLFIVTANIDSLSFREVDVLDPPLFFSFLKSRFVVCSGHQPSLVSIYDYQCSVVKSFPSGVRNRVFFNSHMNLVAFCGFENLAGNIEIYDVQTMKVITKLKVLGASLLSWSPNGSYFIVSVTNCMKEDNRITMYDYYGREIKRTGFSNLVKSEWIGDTEGFVSLERPETLNLKEEVAYVVPSFGSLKPTTPAPPAARKKGPTLNAGAKRVPKPPPQSAKPSISDVMKELDDIQNIKEKQERGAVLSVAELNKLLRENSLLKCLKNLEAE
ncbi:UNVERIFIED_CONTAM: hypothetical protein PYX00_011327 [Menopon gallinae]|uniref:Eukaryotic translation initiation factor 2A n=1 Tax=Menopon gallinae TaxID=328185 RepID=A0AAW2H775_9NEOP